MSDAPVDAPEPRTRPDRAGFGAADLLAYLPAVGVVAAMAAYLSVFYHVTDVVGGTEPLTVELAATVLLATWLGRTLRERAAVLLSAVGLALALTGYFLSVPESARALFTVSRVAADVLALVTGLPVLRLLNVREWALFLAPVPTFLAWYLVVRRRFVWAAVVAGAATGFFVLTSDAGPGATLAAVVGVTVAVGFAGLDAADVRAVSAQWDTLAVVLAAMVALTSVVTVVPGSAASPVLPGAPSPTVESSLVTNDDRVGIVGSISLSPEVRFTVDADRSEYWRVGAYDRYTGGGWTRSGQAEPYEGSLDPPAGDTARLRQRVTARTDLDALPAAWKPVRLRGTPADTAQVTTDEGLRPGTTLLENDTYTVVSAVPNATAADLRRAGTDYPDEVASRYTQLPGSTPDRVANRTNGVLDEAGVNNPYDAAVAVEEYLEANNSYSLDVAQPGSNVADAFLFEMESGYCVYFATTMTVMLRTQGIPARFVTGYTPGQRVAEDEWVVRGLDSHAWVEVYFPETGWVRFDPTPGGARESVEQSRVDSARSAGEENVDTEGSANGSYTTPTAAPANDTGSNGTPSVPAGITPAGGVSGGGPGVPTPSGTNLSGVTPGDGVTPAGGAGGGGDGDDGGWTPTRDDAVLGAAVLLGLVAGARRFGLTARAYRAVWLVHQSRSDPRTDAERAFRRLEYLAGLVVRPRRPGETPRQYLEAVASSGLGDRALAVGRAYERARYGRGVSDEDADAAVEATNALVWEHAPVLRRVGRRLG
ncbi:DUF3488 and transglutaminase-like domain-containing protein [Candidatus Halobonum tyrrellensis]|uniref:Transglutaminase-like enzyme, cysteine protease n=1 Tax=Candidatus Halobonum tyrrellensis G22 TaxID=1324957 RepID=V4H988_9EURY|nr:transglutaminaseTgpA domain-containing protein [Candidatus Halobonum tyrrellensis]ESP87285.1 transglutaminase-like enzyme, cysteine protease [Candidatus Halobonum tyrrellensis G22]